MHMSLDIAGSTGPCHTTGSLVCSVPVVTAALLDVVAVTPYHRPNCVHVSRVPMHALWHLWLATACIVRCFCLTVRSYYDLHVVL
jgi:hypothetical protein